MRQAHAQVAQPPLLHLSPKHYAKDVMYFANTRDSDQVLYAGYWPGLDLKRIASEIENDLDLRDHVWPKFLRENALRVFNLDD